MINNQLDEAVKRNLLQAIADVDPDIKALQEGQDIEDIKRQVSQTQIANVRVGWEMAKAIITDKHPQGMLPTVTSLKDAQGTPLKWEDYYSKINVDEFLKTIQVTMQVSATFADLPIHSVEVKIRYPHGPNAKTQEFTFTNADDVKKFEAFVHQGNRKFLYSYKVNYKNSTFSYQSEERGDRRHQPDAPRRRPGRARAGHQRRATSTSTRSAGTNRRALRRGRDADRS